LGAGLVLTGPAGASEVLAPASWAGRWDFVITHRSRETGAVLQLDRITNDICPGQPVGMALFESVPNCQPRISDTGLSVECGTEVAIVACRIQTTLQIALEQTDPATIGGSGEWTTAMSGDCLIAEMESGRTIEVVAHRQSDATAGACGQPSTLVQKFAVTPTAFVIGDRPFGAFTVDPIDMEGGDFELEGTLTLGPASDGADPRADSVRLQVGDFETKIPPGSFKLRPARGKGGRATYTYEGPAGKARLEVRIVRLDDRRFTFDVHAERTKLRRTASKIPVVLAFGNDTGTTAAATRRPGGRHQDCDVRRAARGE
jgi:hypothetical protein